MTKLATARPGLELRPGSYMVNAAYGRAHLTRKLEIKAGQEVIARFILNAGGLRITGLAPDGSRLNARQMRYDIYSDDRDQLGRRKLVMRSARPGLIIRLNAGIYYIVSHYGDANASVQADVSVVSGKLTEAVISHLAARVRFKLVQRRGSDAVAGTKWQIYTTNGKLVKTSFGAIPSHILAAGRYKVVAQRGNQKYQRQFEVKSNQPQQVEVVMN